ncbi:MAG: amino acid ABC transporter ATP-binding protein [Myxococcota bacterium]
MLEIRQLTKQFGALQVLNGIDLTVSRGDVVVIIGPSGCGKSTLLRCMNQLERPTSGTLHFGGQPVDTSPAGLVKLRTRVGMVFQRFNLFPHLTVMENLLLAPEKVKGLSRSALETQAHALLARVGLAEKAHAYPLSLSGGQQQRVAIARCLMMEPELLLFDEPTSALDPELVGDVLEVMRSLAREGRTMCVVTHEIGFAREVGSRILMLDKGKIIEEGPPAQLLERPSHARTQQFLQRVLHHAV